MAKYTIEDVRRYVQTRDIKLVSNKYKNVSTKYEWKCLKCDTVWSTTYNSIRAGTGCPTCAKEKNKLDRQTASPHKTKMIQQEANKHNVELLSEYIRAHDKMKFRCKIHDIVFYRDWNRIQQRGAWCPECAKESGYKKIGNANRKHDIKHFHKYAEELGGKCHTKKYRNNIQYLEFSCKNGHRFKTRASSIINGYWCQPCGIDGQKLDEEEDGKFIEDNGGKLLSKYKNNRTKMKIQCNKCSNIWENSFGHLKKGQWCPYCAFGKSEHQFREVIEGALGVKFPKKYPKWLINPKTGNRLQLDGYNEELGVAFEYQGYQHFEQAYYDKDEKALQERKFRDKIKKKLCKKYGVKLLCPTYKMKQEDFESYITDNI